MLRFSNIEGEIYALFGPRGGESPVRKLIEKEIMEDARSGGGGVGAEGRGMLQDHEDGKQQLSSRSG